MDIELVKYSGNEKVTLRKFTESIILSITAGHTTEDLQCGKQKINAISPNPQAHMIRDSGGPKAKLRKRWKGCYEKNIHK